MKKKFLFIFLLLFSGSIAQSQNMLQGDVSPELEQDAKDRAEKWAEELSMTAKQTSLMEDKLIEYALKKEDILQSKLREEVKSEMLLNLQREENEAMRDILTGPQHKQYLFLLRQEVKQRTPEDGEAPPEKKE